MKVRSVTVNNRKKAFEVQTAKGTLLLPFAKTDPLPSAADHVARVWVDEEIGREGFSFRLVSGAEGTVHIEQVLEYNQDPDYLRDLLLYRLTLEAQARLEASPLSRREIIRRLGTSASQFYRLIDPTNYRKSIDQLLALLHVLECEVDLVVRSRSA